MIKEQLSFYIRMMICALLIVGAAGETKAQDKQPPLVLKMAGPDFSPYYFYNDDHELDGYIVHLYAKILQRANIQWRGQVFPAKRVMSSLVRGDFDSSILVKNPILDKSGNILSSPYPVAELILNIYAKKDQLLEPSIDVLKGKRVLVMRGYGYGGLRSWLEDPAHEIDLVVANNFSSAIKMLESGRSDYGLLYDVNFKTGERELKRKAKSIFGVTLNRVPLYLHLNKQTVPDAPKVLETLMESYLSLIKDGVLAPAHNIPEEVLGGKKR